MICAYCNCTCGERDRFCMHCGAPLAAEKKGRHWVPILIMAIVFSIGLGLFFAFPGEEVSKPAAGGSNHDTPWFSVTDGVLYFDENRYEGSGELTVPEVISDQTVTALGEGCFENCTGLTGVTLPDTLQAIGEDAFRGCTSLRGVKIPESVYVIGKGAFQGCTSLESICCYESMKFVGENAFADCSKLFYIYFVGDFETWNQLYPQFINPYTVIFSNDGSFYQGGDPY